MAAELAVVPEPPGPREIVALLAAKGPDTLASETNLCRAPIFWARERLGSLIPYPMLYRLEIKQTSGRVLSEGDHRVFADIITRWLRANCPDDRTVEYTLADAAAALGLRTDSGRTRELARNSLIRLRGATYQSRLRHRSGVEVSCVWGHLDTVVLVQRSGRRDGHVVISGVVATLVAEGMVTWLHAPTWDALRERDGLAARLWTFLEAEDLRGSRSYSIFGRGGASRSLPAIADLLGLSDARSARVVRRVAAACEVVADCDHRYSASVVAALGGDKWHVEVQRARGRAGIDPAAEASPDPSGLPAVVMTAWRRAYSWRRPSAKQIEVLGELLTRWGPDELVAILQSGEGDPLARATVTDTGRSRSRHDGEAARVHEVEADHAREAAGEGYMASLAALRARPAWAEAPLPGPSSCRESAPVRGVKRGTFMPERGTSMPERGTSMTGPEIKTAPTVGSTVGSTVGDSRGEAPFAIAKEVQHEQ